MAALRMALLVLVVVLGWLAGVLGSLNINTFPTIFVGNTGTNSLTHSAPPYLSKLSELSFKFAAEGLVSVRVCQRGFTVLGDGSAYIGNSVICENFGCLTPDCTPDKKHVYSPYEWTTQVHTCMKGSKFQWIQFDSNLGNTWVAGTYANCTEGTIDFNINGAVNVVRFAEATGASNKYISGLGFESFTCSGTDCPTKIYNGGGICGTNNGGCDLLTNCTNVVETVSCSACPADYVGTGAAGCVPSGTSQAAEPVYSISSVIRGSQASGNFGTFISSSPHSFKFSRIAFFYKAHSNYHVFTAMNVCMRNVTTAGTYTAGEYCVSFGSGVNGAVSAGEFIFSATQVITTVQSCTDSTYNSILFMRFNTSDGATFATGDPGLCTTNWYTEIFTPGQTLIGLKSFKQTHLLEMDIHLYISGMEFTMAQCTSNCPATFYGPVPSPCQSNNGGCSPNAVCSDNGSSVTSCICKPGYTGNGYTCGQIDLCATSPCAAHSTCSQPRPNFYTCSNCQPGYIGTGYTECILEDPCNTLANVCNGLAKCENLQSNSVTCVCPSNYTSDGAGGCNDLNECTTLATPCPQNTTCNNLPGTYECVCASGYSGPDPNSCVDVNECQPGFQNNCSINAKCINSVGSYSCQCNSGYHGNGTTCTDNNECDATPGPCSVNGICSNKPGGFDCNCKPGYSGNGFSCTDDDECALQTHNCSVNANCSNTGGGFKCTCKKGYTGNGYTCDDVNECSTPGSNLCNVNAQCSNTGGSYTCTCNTGYTGNGTICTEVNECDSPVLNNCSSNAICANSIGSYSCTCKSGFTGDGYVCNDINECDDPTTYCKPPFSCINTPGTFICDCPRGFYLANATTCADINECEDGKNAGCDFSVKCTNLEGSFSCGECPKGTVGDGFNCTTKCGDGFCTDDEDCLTCARDCPSPCNKCGDGFCDKLIKENCTSCFKDCGPCVTPQCDSRCTEHGVCENGLCICKGEWTGPACTTPKNPIEVGANNTNPDVSVTSTVSGAQLKFVISINNLVELQPDGGVARSINIADLNFTLVITNSSSNTKYNYSTQLNIGAFVSIVIYQFENASTKIEFANTTTIFTPHTLKLSVHISRWPFQALANSLGIIMNSTIAASQADLCVDSRLDESGSLRWFTITINGASLYGQFLDKAEVDDKVRPVTYKLNRDNTVTAILPHFWDYADMDPNFSVLLDGEDKCNEKQNAASGVSSKTVIIVVPLVVGLAVLAGALVVIIPRVQSWWQIRSTTDPTYKPEHDEAENNDDVGLSDIKIERQQDMEVTTAAGRFTVKM